MALTALVGVTAAVQNRRLSRCSVRRRRCGGDGSGGDGSGGDGVCARVVADCGGGGSGGGSVVVASMPHRKGRAKSGGGERRRRAAAARKRVALAQNTLPRPLERHLLKQKRNEKPSPTDR